MELAKSGGVTAPKICLSGGCSRNLRRLHCPGQKLGFLCRKQMSESKREVKRGEGPAPDRKEWS